MRRPGSVGFSIAHSFRSFLSVSTRNEYVGQITETSGKLEHSRPEKENRRVQRRNKNRNRTEQRRKPQGTEQKNRAEKHVNMTHLFSFALVSLFSFCHPTSGKCFVMSAKARINTGSQGPRGFTRQGQKKNRSNPAAG